MEFDANNKEIQQAGKQVFKTISPHAILADYLLYNSSITGTKYLENGGEKIVLRAVDAGNAEFIEKLHKALFLENSSIIYCEKARTAKNDPDRVEIEIKKTTEKFKTLNGVLEIYADDGLDTGGTMIKSVKESEKGNISGKKEYGKPEDRIIYFTHAWLAGRGYENVQRRLTEEIRAREFITTNTRPYIGDGQHHDFKTKTTVLRLAFLLGDAILANELGYDITKRYQDFETKEKQHEFLKELYVIKRHERHFMSRAKKQQEIPEIIKR